MKTFSRTYLPDDIKYNNATYVNDLEATSKLQQHQAVDAKNCVLVLVLSKNLKGKKDLHNRPYQPTKWIFRKK